MGALEEEDDDIYEVEKKQDYDRSVTDGGGGGGEGQFGWTGPHSMGDRWTMECFMKANKTAKPAKVSIYLSVCLSICLFVCLMFNSRAYSLNGDNSYVYS